MSQASDKLFDVTLLMPDSWHNDPPIYKTKYGPGKAYEMLTEESKEILRQLKSDDIKNIRPDYCWSSRRESRLIYDAEKNKKLKLKFDREILKV